MLKQLVKYYRPYKIILFGVLLGSCVTAVLDLLFPILVRHILDVELPNKNLEGLIYWASMLFGLYIINFVVMFGVNYYGHVMSSGMENDMRRDLFAHLESMSFSYYDNSKTGQLLARIMTDIVEVSELTFRGPNDVLICSISMLGTMAMMLYMNPMLGTLISLLLIGKAIHTVFINKKMKAAFRRSRAKSGELSAQTEESLSGMRLVKAFANEKLEHQRFMNKSNELRKVRTESFGILSYFSGMVAMFTNTTNLAVLVCGGYLIADGKINISDFVAFLLYVNLFMKPVLRLTVFTEMYQRGMAGFQRFAELMNLEPQIKDKEDAITPQDVKGHIVFENVSFGYLKDQDVIKNFSLEIKSGEKVAFVGSTGVGKSTICNLLPRFYEPHAGRILLDGVDIRNFTQHGLRKQIGIVQQDVFLFSDSVKFNIAYAKTEATDDEIKAAAKNAVADKFIDALPDGYDTCIGERGVKLSGGQKQRLAIARIFLKNPPVLILDEATSSLDNATEKLIQKALDKLSHNRTTLIVAHRLATVQNVDRIVVLDKNGLVEQGSHKELMALKGEYYKLYQAQFKNEFDA